MKKIIIAIALLAVAGSQVPTAKAGDREWATVGKVLTGVAVADIITHAVAGPVVVHSDYYYAPAPVVYAPQPAYYAPPVVCAPPRVVYAPAYCAPRPVVVYRQPIVVGPVPVAIGFGRHDHGFRGRW